ncbi:MAG: response regulator [Rhodopirellula sp. JB053]
MLKKVLFVDDDPILLRYLEGAANANLGSEFEIVTAEGCKPALEATDASGPFSVVVVDMQMPDVNGIETIGYLRRKMPNATFMMLTANKDLQTAVQAVNDGRVFRFLSKPCPPEDLVTALHAAQAEYQSTVSAKDMLSGTISGTLDLMADLIEMPDGRHIDTGRMLESVNELAKSMSIDLGWEERIAARVFLVGIAMLSPQETELFERLDPCSDEHKRLFARICSVSAGLLKKIPRFDWIGDLLRLVPKAERYQESGSREDTSALLLRVVFYWNYLTMKGMCVEAASATIRRIMPELSDRMVSAVESLNDNRDALCVQTLSIQDLQPGMIPFRDIKNGQGCNVIAGGRPLTRPMIENMQNDPTLSRYEVAIVSSSISNTRCETEALSFA